ncbi:ribonuclease HII [Tamlana sp. 2_MG-2023]|uniref:ribonuclease HII n=1 Tax=unclassified Tamlana TaxID=2614803 RepID=UPI0026E2CE6F|nr:MULTISPECIES: ribonuclease HII [unclassified Tamlana]MDO6761340.1 ribonuclease HII [Tamlana sp. 2_MG-2023]MDO6792046.1 ribonuclease HII [Tamlana sp. 1_MG-2023]
MRFFCIPLLLIFLISCTDVNTKRSELLDFAPNNTSIIIKTSRIDGVKSGITNNDFLKQLSKTSAYKGLESKLENLTYFKPTSDFLICLSEDENDSLQYSVITKFEKSLFETDSIPNYIEESLIYKKKTIIKSTIDDATFYSAVIDSTFFASSSKALVEAVFENAPKDPELKKIYNTTGSDKAFSVVVKPENPFLKSFFIQDSIPLNDFSEYLALDIELNQNSIQFNGISKANDSTKSLINAFKGTVPQENQIQHITPSNSDGFLSMTFDNFKTFEANIRQFQQKDSLTNETTLFNDVIEVGVIYEDDNRAIVLNSLDVIATNDALLGEQSINDNYREVDIYDFSQPDLFQQKFAPLISFNKATNYCVLDQFFVFSDDKDMLQNIISNYQNKTTLAEKDLYKNTKAVISDAASLLQFNNASTLKLILDRNLGSSEDFDVSNYNASAIQYIYDTNFAHVNGVILKNKTKAYENSISEELNIKLDNPLLNNPQFVKNHISKQQEIVVQDVSNNLYLISNKGKILWKKQLQGPVLGRIEQIDMYKNGRLQLVFATPNRVYVLDRNGKDVKPFALKFNDKITQPLAVFDYDNRKNYRLLVTQGKNLLMYDARGKSINGFTFKSANNSIICKPEHFRISGKDYIVFKTQNKLYILNRTGNIRVKTKAFNSFSETPVFEYNNNFTTTTETGDLISVDTRGGVSIKNLNLTKNHNLETTSKTLVAQTENKLLIKDKTTELDFGQYSKPGLFYINDKIYVSTTDLHANKVYLFDSQSELLPNFPVYGNGPIELQQIDKDNRLEFVTKGDANSIILYQIN